MPIASKFNEVVCMDLKDYQRSKVLILHLIDTATWYSVVYLFETKSKDEIVK